MSSLSTVLTIFFILSIKPASCLYESPQPFKMKECILTGTPWWMNWLIGLIRLFISKKMSKRVYSTQTYIHTVRAHTLTPFEYIHTHAQLLNISIAKMYKRIGGQHLLPEGYVGGTNANAAPRYPY